MAIDENKQKALAAALGQIPSPDVYDDATLRVSQAFDICQYHH